MSELNFFVPGIAKGAGSKRAFPVKRAGVPTGKMIYVDSSGEAGKQWRIALQDKGREALLGAGHKHLMTGYLFLECLFVIDRPKGHFRKGLVSQGLTPSAPLFCDKGTDTTKLMRAVEDAFNQVVWEDDRLVTRQYASRVYTHPNVEQLRFPGVHVKIYPLAQPDWMATLKRWKFDIIPEKPGAQATLEGL